MNVLKPVDAKTKRTLLHKWKEEKKIPLTPKSALSFLRQMKKNPDDPILKKLWGKSGRPRLLSPSRIQKFVDNANASCSKAIGQNDVHGLLVSQKKCMAVQMGEVPISSRSDTVPPQTTGMYMSLLATHKDISVCDDAIGKTDTRYTAENLLMSAMAFMTTIAATHFMIGYPDSAAKRKFQDSTASAKYLHDKTSKVHGDLPLITAKPQYVYLQDDTTTYVFCGTETKAPSWMLVGAESNCGAGVCLKYVQDRNPGSKNGLHVKSTFIFNVMGQMATPCISVTGLNDRELPPEHCPNGIFALKIEGLCLSGSTPPTWSSYGWVVFCRNDNDKCMDVKRYCFIFDELLLPFVQSTLQQHDGWIPGTPFPDSLFDGDLPQITHATRNDSLQELAKNKIFANKQSAARSGTEQAADLTRTFTVLAKLQKKITAKNRDLPLKGLLERQFSNLQGKNQLVLKSTKRDALIDFITCFPDILSKAVSAEAIRDGSH